MAYLFTWRELSLLLADDCRVRCEFRHFLVSTMLNITQFAQHHTIPHTQPKIPSQRPAQYRALPKPHTVARYAVLDKCGMCAVLQYNTTIQ